VVLQSRLDAMSKLASAYVERTGADIVSPSGAAFGTGRVKRAVKPKKELYVSWSDNQKGDVEE
jgi:hypothetical protein